jgi:sensor histidine kinase regulating citrate/malate metabolism
MEATLKNCPQDNLPQIIVTVGESESSIMFRVSDQAGGIEQNVKKSVFSLIRGAERNLDHFKEGLQLAGKVVDERPHLNLGISLALSKIYANYWGGDLDLTSVNGFGTDIYLSLSKGYNQAENLNL